MSLKVLDERLRTAERQKEALKIKADLDSIPNSELSVIKCTCGNVTWKATNILYEIPVLHPKNGTGEKLNRQVTVCVCEKCGKANPQHSDIKDKDYIENLPEELKPSVIESLGVTIKIEDPRDEA